MTTKPDSDQALDETRKVLSEFKQTILTLCSEERHAPLDTAIVFVEQQTDLHPIFSSDWDISRWKDYLEVLLQVFDEFSHSDATSAEHRSSIEDMRAQIRPLHESVSIDVLLGRGDLKPRVGRN